MGLKLENSFSWDGAYTSRTLKVIAESKGVVSFFLLAASHLENFPQSITLCARNPST